MARLSPNAARWLKGFHLLAAGCWTAGAYALLCLYFLKRGATDGGFLLGVNRSIGHLDLWVIIVPGALGCLLTGLLYSAFTPWGFFRHRWLAFKWAVTCGAILFGTFFLGPWERAMTERAAALGASCLADPAYLRAESLNFVFGAAQFSLLVLVTFLSVFKPWRKATGGQAAR